jgi:hypothetical protein
LVPDISIDPVRSRLSITSTMPPLATAVEAWFNVVELIPITFQNVVARETTPVTCIVSLLPAVSEALLQKVNVVAGVVFVAVAQAQVIVFGDVPVVTLVSAPGVATV